MGATVAWRGLIDGPEQARRVKRLLAAVVANAVRDLAAVGNQRDWRKQPVLSEHERQTPRKTLRDHKLSEHAFTAARFLLDRKNPGVDAYLEWLDIDPPEWRKRLLEMMWDDRPKIVGGFDEFARRAMKVNYLKYLELTWLEIEDEDEDEGE